MTVCVRSPVVIPKSFTEEEPWKGVQLRLPKVHLIPFVLVRRKTYIKRDVKIEKKN